MLSAVKESELSMHFQINNQCRVDKAFTIIDIIYSFVVLFYLFGVILDIK